VSEPVTCEMREQPAQPVLVVRATTSARELKSVLGQGFGAVARYLGGLGEAPAGPPFVAYHNDDMEHLDLEIGFPVSRPLPGTDDIQAGEIPGGQQAICTFVGPYTEISAAYDTLSRWLRERRLEPTGVVYEFYLNDPAVTPPEQLQTQIVFPLKAVPV